MNSHIGIENTFMGKNTKNNNKTQPPPQNKKQQ